MKVIVVPTDYSAIAVNAMNYAIEMAQAVNANLMLVHVYQIPVSLSNDVYVPIIGPEELQKINDERIQELKREVEHISFGKLKVYAEARLGNVVDELQELCKSIQPLAVVMGTKGESAVERIFMGSNTLLAIRHLNAPVIVVPPGAIFKGIKKIGLACDFKMVVESIPTDLIRELVNTFHAELEVLNVDYNSKHFKPDTPEQSLLLHTLLEDLKPKYFFINNPVVEDGISEFAENNNIDLLVVIPKKHKLLDSLFQKSHTRQLAFHSHIPIASIHE
jgi:nucleotide-binding universal stress UspA family protein